MTINTRRLDSHLTSKPVGDIVSKTYQLLAVSVAVSALTAWFGRGLPFAYEHPFILMLLGFAALLAVIITGSKDQPIAIPLVVVFTGLMGLSLGPVIEQTLQLANGSLIVTEATGGTAIIFIGLSLYAAVSKRDFSVMGGFLMTGLIIAILAGIANFWLRIPALQLTIAAASMLIFSGYTLIDTQRLLQGGETRPVLLMVSLYLDVLNMFVALLQLLTAFQGRR